MGREGVEPCIVVIAAATAAVAASVTAARSHDAELLGEREREREKRGKGRNSRLRNWRRQRLGLEFSSKGTKDRQTDRQDSQI